MIHSTRLILALFLMFAGIGAPCASAANASSVMGEPFKELSSLHCLGMRWKIKGDSNKNAAINVQYRKKGATDWKQGFPLFRTIPNKGVEAKNVKRHALKGEWMFAGSIFNLTPDTAYEVKLHFKDPDGGEASTLLNMRTWKEPVEPKGMIVKHVVPGNGGGTGTEKDPFKGLEATKAASKPGTLFLLHKGTYVKGDFKNNTWPLRKSGAPGKPIIYRAAGDGEAIIDGGGEAMTKGVAIAAAKAKHIWFENLSFQGRFFMIVAPHANHLVVRGCRARNCVMFLVAIRGSYDSCQRFLVVDNDFRGPTTWPRSKGIEPYDALELTGSGHVVAYNRFTNMGDCVHGTNHGTLSSTDYHNNEINTCTDDGIETDGSEFNLRVYNNRMLNVSHAITGQPVLTGPVYVFRNFMYNVTYSPFKLHNNTTGLLLMHNTCVKGNANGFTSIPGSSQSVINVYTRNNLFLSRGGLALRTTGSFKQNDFDNDGYGGWTDGFAQWNGKKYKTAALAAKAGACYIKHGAHKINPATCFESKLQLPDKDKRYVVKEVDFSLAAKSDAVDKGVVLANFNDGFSGKAPDLGAIEFGAKMPHFGPREGTAVFVADNEYVPTADDLKRKVAGLLGYCPVSFQRVQKCVKGLIKFSTAHENVTYYFADKEALDLFVKTPAAYLPANKGYCVVSKSKSKNSKVRGHPELFSVYKDKLHLHSQYKRKNSFDNNPEKYLAKTYLWP